MTQFGAFKLAPESWPVQQDQHPLCKQRHEFLDQGWLGSRRLPRPTLMIAPRRFSDADGSKPRCSSIHRGKTGRAAIAKGCPSRPIDKAGCSPLHKVVVVGNRAACVT